MFPSNSCPSPGASCWLGASPLLPPCSGPGDGTAGAAGGPWGRASELGAIRDLGSLKPISSFCHCLLLLRRTAAWCHTSTVDAASTCNLLVARQEGGRGLVWAAVGIFASRAGLQRETCLEGGKVAGSSASSVCSQIVCDEPLFYCTLTAFLFVFLLNFSLAVELSGLMFCFTYVQYLHVIFNVWKQTCTGNTETKCIYHFLPPFSNVSWISAVTAGTKSVQNEEIYF